MMGVLDEVFKLLRSSPKPSTPVPAADASGDWTLDLSSDDLMSEASRFTKLFLRKYSETGMRSLLAEVGILDHIASKGYENATVRFDLADPFLHSMFIEARHPSLGSSPVVLMELHLRIVTSIGELKLSTTASDLSPGQMLFLKGLEEMQDFRLLECDFLRLQSPCDKFTQERPALPGQDYPGLGCMRQAGMLLNKLANDENYDAVANAPQHFQNALLYNRNGYVYANPEVQGGFQSLLVDLDADLHTHGLSVIANAVLQGRLFMRLPSGASTRVLWAPEQQLYPLSERMKKYFSQPEYTNTVETCTVKNVFSIDWECALADANELAQSYSLRAAIRLACPSGASE